MTDDHQIGKVDQRKNNDKDKERHTDITPEVG